MGIEQRPEVDFSSYVRMRLRHIGMSQAQLARSTGISRPALVKLLNGKTRAPRLETTRAMAAALGVSPIHLVGLLTGASSRELVVGQPAFVTGNGATVTDVTLPRGSRVPAGDRFEKVWDLRNTGRTDWRGHRLRCIDHALSPSFDVFTQAQYFLRPDAMELPVPYTAPGDIVRLSIWFTAPRLSLACVSLWRMVDAAGLDTQIDPLSLMVVVDQPKS